MKTQELVTKVHEDAKAKGWWEKPRSIQELFMLCITEIAEATEEARKGTPSIYFVADMKGIGPLPLIGDGVIGDGIASFEQIDWEVIGEEFKSKMKPEGELIELADVVIRLFDIAGAHNFDMSRLEGKSKELNTEGWDNPLQFHFDLCQTLCFGNRPAEQNAVYTYTLIRAYCEMKEWDLDAAVELKIKYNETRAHRHGGKKILTTKRCS